MTHVGGQPRTVAPGTVSQRSRHVDGEAPEGWAGLWRVLTSLPRALVRHPLHVLARGLVAALVLDLVMRLFLHPPGEHRVRNAWIFLEVLALAAAYGVVFVLGATWVARASARRYMEPPARGSDSRWAGSFGYGAALVGTCAFGAFGALFVLSPGGFGREPSRAGLIVGGVVAFLIATVPAAVMGASWLGWAARRLAPGPRPYAFPLRLARFVLAWVLASGCMAAVIWRASCVYRTSVAETSPVALALGHVLPVVVVGWVVAALAEASSVTPASSDIGRVFE
ncbi:MAG: hypothetical protein AB7T63_16670 [Planctomycetota bacterium]